MRALTLAIGRKRQLAGLMTPSVSGAAFSPSKVAQMFGNMVVQL